MTWINALLGKLYDTGVALELRGILNFIGFTFTPYTDPSTGEVKGWNVEAPGVPDDVLDEIADLTASAAAWADICEPDLLGTANNPFAPNVLSTETVEGIPWIMDLGWGGEGEFNPALNQGLHIETDTGSSGNTLEGNPYVAINLPDLGPLGFGSPIRVQVQFELSDGFATNGHELLIGFQSKQNNGFMNVACVKRTGGATLTHGFVSFGGATRTHELATAPIGANDTVTIDVYPDMSTEIGFSEYAATGWDAPTPQGGLYFVLATGVSGVHVINGPGDTTTHGRRLVICVNSASTGVVAGVNIKRLRVRQWQRPA